MILAVDIGNTTVAFGLFDGRRLAAHVAIATHPPRTAKALRRELGELAGEQGAALSRIRRITLCSVVPQMSASVVRALQVLTKTEVRVVGRDLRVPLKNRYTDPGQVGQDRLVGAYAAWRRYQTDCVIADFGTAITIDVVRKAGEYLGGVIAPGLEISLKALAENTALLPRATLKKPTEWLGRDTENSIRSGVLHGFAALCDGLVLQLKRRYAPRASVVATGGASALIAPYTRCIGHVRPHLVLEGLRDLTSGQPTTNEVLGM